MSARERMLQASRAAGWTLLLLGVAAGARAQGPEAAWRTLETPHFRIYCPAEAEAWSRRLAGRLESIRQAVGREVGYTPPQRIDVVVADPEASANGSAWPLLARPRLVLWTTPPGPTSTLGHLSDWGELLAVHEYSHLAHLLRPSRNPLRAGFARVLVPVGPLAVKTPRWAIEGYATLLEGRLTGSGRPASALRAAVVRTWARAGRLPSYGALSSRDDVFLGGSMAYLVGSSFLEWSETRSADPRILPKLWAAATARRNRDFAAAWTRVFGDPPAHAYDRYVAETTAAALAEERSHAAELSDGEIWLRRDWATGAPALSRDGKRLAALLYEHERPARLVVWATDAAVPATRDEATDPEDPSAVSRPPARRDELASLEEPPGTRFLAARFLPDGESLLITLLAPDHGGFRHAELARWTPGAKLRQLTRHADVRDADPMPDGRSAVAVRWRGGASQLVRVELADGTVTPLTPPSLDAIQDEPRISPDGRHLAWLAHRGGRWGIRLAELASSGSLGELRDLVVPADGEPIALAWRGNGSHLYASVARGGRISIEALPVAPGARYHRVTETLGADLDPAPTPDGRTLFYLSLSPDGLDLRRLPLDAATEQEETSQLPSQPANRLAPREPRGDAAGSVGPARPYGLGRAELTPIFGGWVGSGPDTLELGVRAGDLLGRWQLLALAGLGGGEATRHGGALRASLRVLPATLELSAARLDLESTRADSLELALDRSLDFGRSHAAFTLGLARNRFETPGRDRDLAFAAVALDSELRCGAWSLRPGLLARQWSRIGGAAGSWSRVRGTMELAAGDAALVVLGERDESRRVADALDRVRLGGVPSSLAPPSLEPGRIDQPALAVDALAGARIDRLAARLRLPQLPLDLLAERDRVPGGETVRLIGVERGWALAPLPLVGLPALELRLGVARVSGTLRRDSTRWWLGLRVPFNVAGAEAALDSPR